jgi:hypothetical protein
MEAVIRSLGVRSEDCYFWGVHNQGEVDLLIDIIYPGKSTFKLDKNIWAKSIYEFCK